MILRYTSVQSLPQLSWCAKIEKDTGCVSVAHGSGIEIGPSGFVEGAWNGPFASFDIANATVVCGTGAFTDGRAIRFFSSTDRLSPIFSIVSGGALFVSNSPIFALSRAGVQPHEAYPFYSYDLIGIWREGLYCLSGDLRTNSAESLRVHFSATMAVNSSLETRFDVHPLCEEPTDYQSYFDKLAGGVRQVYENADDPLRQQRFRPLAAISKGYDSTATAVLASKAGCREAYTFVDSRKADKGIDSGCENAVLLGMSCTEYDRWTYLDKSEQAQAEFGFCAISTTAPIVALEDCLPGRILTSGHAGDTFWEERKSALCDQLSQPWARLMSGVNQIEFRLRVGYLAFAPVLIGARHNRAIHNITRSDEMKPWSVPGTYDRPIPRRIAEDAGLPRESFGMNKAAVGHSHFVSESNFSAKALAGYRDFIAQDQSFHRHLSGLCWRFLALVRNSFWSLIRQGKRIRIVKSTRLQRTFPFILNASPIKVPVRFMLTFQWAFSRLVDRYRLPGVD